MELKEKSKSKEVLVQWLIEEIKLFFLFYCFFFLACPKTNLQHVQKRHENNQINQIKPKRRSFDFAKSDSCLLFTFTFKRKRERKKRKKRKTLKNQKINCNFNYNLNTDTDKIYSFNITKLGENTRFWSSFIIYHLKRSFESSIPTKHIAPVQTMFSCSSWTEFGISEDLQSFQ